MGQLRFEVDQRDLLTEERLVRSFVAGPDETPFFGRSILSDRHLIVEREESSSGCFTIPWPVAGQGDWLVATSTLMEREEPYLLEVELARGLLFRLRDQLANWELLGLIAPEDLKQTISEATQSFSRAATSRSTSSTQAAEHARKAMEIAAVAAGHLTQVYADQALALRRTHVDKLNTLLGVRMSGGAPKGDASDKLAETFNLVSVPCGWGAVEPSEGKRDWSEIDGPVEWASSRGLRICGGPLLEFDERRLPDWAYLWEGDIETLASLMIGHVRASVERYRGRVQLWHVASRVNRDRILSLSDEQRLQIVAGAVRAVRELDPNTPVVVGIDQPWAEYRGRRPTELAPIDFADALERADLGIAGFDLELNIGYYPLATALRNPLAFSRLIDMWNVRLEAPLMLTITLPSKSEQDPQADPKVKVVAGGETPDLITPEWQSDWARERLPMLLAKNSVQVVLWGQMTDQLVHSFPHGGLFNASGEEKPILESLKALRSEYLV